LCRIESSIGTTEGKFRAMQANTSNFHKILSRAYDVRGVKSKILSTAYDVHSEV
jgi:hypothetical protein